MYNRRVVQTAEAAMRAGAVSLTLGRHGAAKTGMSASKSTAAACPDCQRL